VCYNFVIKENYDPERNTPMPSILPIQKRFDKSIPDNFGNCEYRSERELLIAIDSIINQCHLEDPVISYFLDAALVDKYISVFSTGKSARLTSEERDNARADAVLALRMSILRKRLGLSLRKFSLALSHSDLYKWFCGINRFCIPNIPGKTKVGDLENYIPEALIQEIEKRLLRASDSCQVLDEPLDFSRSYFDCTCIRTNIHYPIDWVLLRDSTLTLMKATARIRKLGLVHRMPFEPSVFITKMNKLCMEMTFTARRKDAKKLRKKVLRKMKNLLKRVNNHTESHLRLLESKWQTVDISRSQAEQIARQITDVTSQLAAVIKQAHERIIGERKVDNKDKILSLYEKDVHIVVRRKAGAQVEFGNTLFLAEQQDGLIVDWKLFKQQAPADSKMLKGSHQRTVNRLGHDVTLLSGDRGFDSKANQRYMESNDIFNAVCPRNPQQLIDRLKDDTFRDAQRRRSQTEARISILSHCFCGVPMKQKGFEHRQIHMGLSVLSHNLWVLGRLKIAQEQRQQQAA
jgi:hypothetical protein